MNKVCLYYGIICGVFLTSTAAPAADCTVGAIGGGDYAAAYCLKQPGGKYFLPGVAQLQLLAARKKEVDAVLAKLRAATGDGRIYWSADENRSTDALAVAMDDGGVYGSYKETLLSVRCVISY